LLLSTFNAAGHVTIHKPMAIIIKFSVSDRKPKPPLILSSE
jgi:hypothetical protein